MKHRFFLSAALEPGATVEVTGDEYHHARRVRRIAVGEEIEIFDGVGHGVVAVAVAIDDRSISARITGPAAGRESARAIRLALAMIHPDRFELVVQKGTELGVSAFTPVVSDRCEIRADRARARLERWNRIALEAAKQSGRTLLPRIDDPAPFQQVLDEGGTRILFDADESPVPCPGGADQPVTLLIGPEGGWSDGEIDAARAAGAFIERLGPRRLRAETAAIAAVALMQYRLGEIA